MTSGSYRFMVGDYECFSLTDGSFDYPLESFFANVPEAEVVDVLRARGLPTGHLTTPYSLLYVNTGDAKVLVDMGAGNLAPDAGKLIANLRAAGVEPADIDQVIITHAHPDHIGGALGEDGQPIYANARHLICKREWDFWFSERAGELAPEFHVTIARDNLKPIQEQVYFVEAGSEVLPGIELLDASGHTPGHVAVAVASAGERLIYLSDTALSPLHLEYPEWQPALDIDPDKAAITRQRICDLAAAEHTLILGMHFPPLPSLGHIVKQEKGWLWQPLDAAKGSTS